MENHFILTPYYLDEYTPGLEALAQPGWQTNKLELPEGNKQSRMGALYRPLAEAVAEAAQRGQRPVSVAGDCCTTIGVLAGLQRVGINPLLLWFDAHGDFNTWETTPSGFLGGMPLAMLVGRGEATIAEAVGLRPLPEAQMILTDARDLDPGERLALEGSDVVHLPKVTGLLDHPLGDRPLYVHFDTDTLDPTDAPAMNYLAPGGPSADELGRVFRFLAATGRVVAASLSSWNPAMDEDGRTREVCMRLMGVLTM